MTFKVRRCRSGTVCCQAAGLFLRDFEVFSRHRGTFVLKLLRRGAFLRQGSILRWILATTHGLRHGGGGKPGTIRIPARVYFGPDAVAPADFLASLAFTFHYYHEHHALPLTNNIALGTHFEILPARHVAQDSPDLFGGWVIHREGFRAPNILAVARLQAWTLKPAIRSK